MQKPKQKIYREVYSQKDSEKIEGTPSETEMVFKKILPMLLCEFDFSNNALSFSGFSCDASVSFISITYVLLHFGHFVFPYRLKIKIISDLYYDVKDMDSEVVPILILLKIK